MKCCSGLLFGIVLVLVFGFMFIISFFEGIGNIGNWFDHNENNVEREEEPEELDGISLEIYDIQEIEINYNEIVPNKYFCLISSEYELHKYYRNVSETFELGEEYLEITNQYNYTYFNNHRLVILYMEETNRCTEHNFKNSYESNNKAHIVIESIINESIVESSEMTGWLIFLECEKGEYTTNQIVISNNETMINEAVEQNEEGSLTFLFILILMGLGIYYLI